MPHVASSILIEIQIWQAHSVRACQAVCSFALPLCSNGRPSRRPLEQALALGDLQLGFPDGTTLRLHSTQLILASPVLRGMIATAAARRREARCAGKRRREDDAGEEGGEEEQASVLQVSRSMHAMRYPRPPRLSPSRQI